MAAKDRRRAAAGVNALAADADIEGGAPQVDEIDGNGGELDEGDAAAAGSRTLDTSPVSEPPALPASAWPCIVTVRNHGGMPIHGPAGGTFIPPGDSRSIALTDRDHARIVIGEVREVAQRLGMSTAIEVDGLPAED